MSLRERSLVLPRPTRDAPRPTPPPGPTSADVFTTRGLFREHGDAVARWAARLGGPLLEVEDVVQEVFLTAHRQLPTFRGDAKPATWLFGITQNVVRHRRRRERLRRLVFGASTDAADAVSNRPTPVEMLERREAERAVYAALSGLADKYRTVFILFEIEGLSGAEIAELTGLHPTTLRVHLHRARAQFASRLERTLGSGARP